MTGADSGLGAVVAKAVGAAGGSVILAHRSTDKARPVAAAIGPKALPSVSISQI